MYVPYVDYVLVRFAGQSVLQIPDMTHPLFTKMMMEKTMTGEMRLQPR